MINNVLNPALYLQLVKVFGSVGVVRPGEPMVMRKAGSLFKRKSRPEIVEWGESYSVSCPYCNDSGQRLSINHRWSAAAENKMFSKFIHCYNENCEECSDFLDVFIKKLGSVPDSTVITPDPQVVANAGLKPVRHPGECVAVHKLPRDHIAAKYLIERRYDLEELGTVWDVSWCTYSLILPPRNRLFVPLYDLDSDGNKILVGGQARWLDIETGSSKPTKASKEKKWYTLPGSRPSRTLFNSWRARQQSDIVVVVEGPFDAMRLGPDISVAVFGHNISKAHEDILKKYWGNSKCVIWMDPDTNEDKTLAKRTAALRQYWGNNLIRIQYAGSSDIGDMSRAHALQILEEAILNNARESKA